MCSAASKAFEITLAGDEAKMLSGQGVIINPQISYKEAHERIRDFDVVIVVGGGSHAVLDQKTEPLQLITAYSELQKADPTRERTLMSVCTGSLFLAEQGILAGLSATTHPNELTRFENICSNAATRDLAERTDVIEDARYVVNNLRFDLGDEDENPYIRRKSDARRTSNARFVSSSPTWNIFGANNRYAERAACPGRAPTRNASPWRAAPRCALVASASSQVGASALASMRLCISSASWFRRSRRTRWLGSCNGLGAKALSLMVWTFSHFGGICRRRDSHRTVSNGFWIDRTIYTWRLTIRCPKAAAAGLNY